MNSHNGYLPSILNSHYGYHAKDFCMLPIENEEDFAFPIVGGCAYFSLLG